MVIIVISFKFPAFWEMMLDLKGVT